MYRRPVADSPRYLVKLTNQIPYQTAQIVHETNDAYKKKKQRVVTSSLSPFTVPKETSINK